MIKALANVSAPGAAKVLIIQAMHPFPARRRALSRLLSLPMLVLASAAPARTKSALRIGLTPVFLDDQIGFIARWRRYLEEKMARPVGFIQRGNYREIVDLLLTGKLDCAWLCGYPYVRHRHRLRLVATPLWQGKPLYQSYLLVAASDRQYQRLDQLRGKVFAYSDPDSNSGYLYPQHVLRQSGENPVSFFARTFFTWAHRTVVEAVSVGLADGGAVDGYIWEMLALIRPQLTAGTRIIERSPWLGFPPFVARHDIATGDLNDLRAALLGMAADGYGTQLLGQLGLDGFIAGNPGLYDGIARMMERAGSGRS